jgi:hypothetical protein
VLLLGVGACEARVLVRSWECGSLWLGPDARLRPGLESSGSSLAAYQSWDVEAGRQRAGACRGKALGGRCLLHLFQVQASRGWRVLGYRLVICGAVGGLGEILWYCRTTATPVGVVTFLKASSRPSTMPPPEQRGKP